MLETNKEDKFTFYISEGYYLSPNFKRKAGRLQGERLKVEYVNVLWDDGVVERDWEAKRNVMVSRVVLADQVFFDEKVLFLDTDQLLLADVAELYRTELT